MRVLAKAEKSKRGCVYCKKVAKMRPSLGRGIRLACPYEECPYRVLDKYDAYGEYMKSKDSKIDGLPGL